MKNFLVSERFILFLTSIASLVALYFSYSLGYILAYNDAAAHLNTARRIVDSLIPGLVQIGSVWLPLLHILEMPFVMNDFLWQTGLAGAIVSGLSFILGSLLLFKLIYYVTRSKLTSLIGVLVFITNLNILYLQTTAMFEPLLIVNAIGTIYFLTKWGREHTLKDLVLAAIFTMLATLTRYDGWALFLSCCGFVLLVSILQKKRGFEGTLLIFLFLAGFGIFLWLLYNQLIFADPLYFAQSEFSAKSQQDILLERGQLPTKHNLPLSFITYSLSTAFNLGVLTVGLLILGVLFYLKDHLLKIPHWAPLLLLIPYGFNIISLYLGQSVIWLPMIPPYFETYFNARYGILMLPAAAFFIGYLAYKHTVLKYLVFISIVIQLILFLKPEILPLFGKEISIITLQDTVSSVNNQTLAASKFLHDNHQDGLIMVSSASADAFIFRAGIPLKYFITEGTGYYWRDSLKDPTKYATWLVFFKDRSDRVGKVVGKSPTLNKHFDMVYQDQTYEIWKKK